MSEIQTCTLCGAEAQGCRARTLVFGWTAMLYGRMPVEREVVCPSCRQRERPKTLIGAGLLVALAAGMIIATAIVIR